MSIVYALKLEKNKYYIGKTNDIKKRYDEHCSGKNSSVWTRKYKPIKIIETINNAHCLEEDKMTVCYMMKYGIENVRGGPFVSITLPSETIEHITRRIRMASDVCVKCGSPDHFCAFCPRSNNLKVSVFIDTTGCRTCMSRTHFTEDCEFSKFSKFSKH